MLLWVEKKPRSEDPPYFIGVFFNKFTMAYSDNEKFFAGRALVKNSPYAHPYVAQLLLMSQFQSRPPDPSTLRTPRL